jgi:cutinase
VSGRIASLLLVALAAATTAAGVVAAVARPGQTWPCSEVTLVFARGSGQRLGEREAPMFFETVGGRVGDTATIARYELGSGSYGGSRYPAVGGSWDVLEAEASWAGFLGGQYRASVAAGVAELTGFLSQRAHDCPHEVFVVGGYSQGAQVVGEALFELSTATRDRIAFVALFSDPKLYLPEGRGPLPPACRGDESPWRRGGVSCWTDNGILEARTPYLPEDIAVRTGSWCDRNDGVCNGNVADLAWYDDHAEYARDAAEIEEAAGEIATVLGDLVDG